MMLAALMSNMDINWEQTFVANLLADHKVFRRENRIKLGGQFSSIILEALKTENVLWFNFMEVISSDMMLQSDALAQLSI